MLTPTTPKGSSYRLFYSGPVGVAGVGVQQTLDVTSLPDAVLEDPTFADNWRIFVRQVDPGITNVSPDVSFLPLTGKPQQMVLTVDAAAPTDNLDIEAWYIQSTVR